MLLGCAHPRPDASSEADPGAAFVYSFGRGVGYSYANQLQFGSRGTGASGASAPGSGLSGSSPEAGRDIAKGLVRSIQTTGARRPLDSTGGGIQLPPLTLGRTTVTAPHPLGAPALNQTVAAENLLPLNTAIADEQKNSAQTTGKESRVSSAMSNLLPIAEYGAFSDDFQLTGENGGGVDPRRPGRSKATEQLSRLAAGDSSSSSRQLPAVKQVQSFDVVAAVPGLPVQPLLQ